MKKKTVKNIIFSLLTQLVCIICGFIVPKIMIQKYGSLRKFLINIYISTRNYQIRGLIYPFIYTLEDGFDKVPDNYNEN